MISESTSGSAQQIGGHPLSVHLLAFPPYVVGQWIGTAPEAASGVAARATEELLERPAEHLVLDLGRLGDVSTTVAQALSQSISRAQRLGRSVILVRCSDQLFRMLQGYGLSGSVRHAGSLMAATQGMSGEQTSTVELYLRSAPEMLRRLRSVVTAVAQEAGLHPELEMQIRSAVNEAATNAMVHGSPAGVRNHVRISIHLDPGALIVDVADQGRGFEPPPPPHLPPGAPIESGFGMHIMREAMDRVEFFRDADGMLVRMTKFFA